MESHFYDTDIAASKEAVANPQLPGTPVEAVLLISNVVCADYLPALTWISLELFIRIFTIPRNTIFDTNKRHAIVTTARGYNNGNDVIKSRHLLTLQFY